MIKILIVDDEQEKRRVLVEVVRSVQGVDEKNIHVETDVVGAKRAISCTHYDLVILDINLPTTQAGKPKVRAGLDILKFIEVNLQAKAPSFVFGITQYEASASAAEQSFSSPIWKLIRFSYKDDSWKKHLRQALKYISSSKLPPYKNDGHSYYVDVAIFAALPIEAEGIMSQGIDWKRVDVPFDSTQYQLGRFHSEGKFASVVLAQAPRMGMPIAAVVATKLIHTFRPKLIAIAGICAGVKDKSAIGDILIADPCFDWGSGKWLEESEKLIFRPAAYQWRLDESIRGTAEKLSARRELLNQIHSSYKGSKPTDPPKVLIDAMASGASVLQSESHMADVREQHKNLIGIEMESYAVFTAAELASEPRPKCISIKSVCDFGDRTKCDTAHAYAAHTSAAFLRELSIASVGNSPV